MGIAVGFAPKHRGDWQKKSNLELIVHVSGGTTVALRCEMQQGRAGQGRRFACSVSAGAADTPAFIFLPLIFVFVFHGLC